MTARHRTAWTFAVTSAALFMASLASGASNAIRELGGVFGIAVLGAVFSARGGYASGTAFVSGLVPAVWVGGAAVTVAAVAALFLPRLKRAEVPSPAAGPARELEAVR